MLLTRDGVRFGSLFFYWYGLLVVLAAYVGIEVSARLAKRDGRSPEHIWRAMIWVLPLAIIGARLWFVVFPPTSIIETGRSAAWLITHFFDINQGGVAVWTGGLGLFGGLLGGLLGAAIYARRNRQDVGDLRPWLDIGAIGLALAQTIGRFANGINQELYGPPTSLPWGMLVDKVEQRVGPYIDLARYPLASTYFHPVWLYEALLCAAIFVILLRFWRRRRLIALRYLLLYGAGRFALEFLRVNVSLVGGINVSQAAAALIAIFGAVLLWAQRAKVPPPSAI